MGVPKVDQFSLMLLLIFHTFSNIMSVGPLPHKCANTVCGEVT